MTQAPFLHAPWSGVAHGKGAEFIERTTGTDKGLTEADRQSDNRGEFLGKVAFGDVFAIGKRKHININSFRGIVSGLVGGKMLFICFSGVIPFEGEKAHRQNPPKIPAQSREFFCLCMFFCVCFWAPNACFFGLVVHGPYTACFAP